MIDVMVAIDSCMKVLVNAYPYSHSSHHTPQNEVHIFLLLPSCFKSGTDPITISSRIALPGDNLTVQKFPLVLILLFSLSLLLPLFSQGGIINLKLADNLHNVCHNLLNEAVGCVNV